MSAEIKKITWTKIIAYLCSNLAIAGIILWSSMGGPSFIEFLFPSVLGMIYTVVVLLLVVMIIAILLIGEVRESVREGFLSQSRTIPREMWNPAKRIFGLVGSACIVIAASQAEWGYITTITILAMASSHVMLGQIRSLYEEAWKGVDEAGTEDREFVKATLIIRKDED